jgi:hypothetical protein
MLNMYLCPPYNSLGNLITAILRKEQFMSHDVIVPYSIEVIQRSYEFVKIAR